MNVTLSKELEIVVERQIQRGLYPKLLSVLFYIA